ncbi:MAG: Zn-ribbon domain-containing protein [Methanoregulaceae archaeon]|nr:Zn-ribbon domain-containing protein [Methanoregulaceae archaeon]
MPHRCVKCGKEYKEASFEVLKGCEQCGGKKFLYTRAHPAGETAKPAIPSAKADKPAPSHPAPDTGKEPPVHEKKVDSAPGREDDRVESIRIVSPGTYELNITKMAESDERVVATGGDGSYMVDLISMMKPRRKKKTEKEL